MWVTSVADCRFFSPSEISAWPQALAQLPIASLLQDTGSWAVSGLRDSLECMMSSVRLAPVMED